MFWLLPVDIRIHIYSYLPISQTKEFFLNHLDDKETMFSYICSFIKTNQQNVFRNLILHSCFRCEKKLTPCHIINICTECKFSIHKDELYPLYCHECYHLKHPRDFVFRNCILCNHYSAVLGITHYS